MEDFIVRRSGNKDGWYMYIGFHEMRINTDPVINCYGLAVIHADDEREYHFSYSFNHSPDWQEVGGMTLKPMKTYQISMEDVRRMASDIFYNIKEFISKMN